MSAPTGDRLPRYNDWPAHQPGCLFILIHGVFLFSLLHGFRLLGEEGYGIPSALFLGAGACWIFALSMTAYMWAKRAHFYAASNYRRLRVMEKALGGKKKNETA